METAAVETWARAEAAKVDATSTVGRAALVSIAFKVARTKTGLDGLGLSLTEQWRKRTGSVNADRNRLKLVLDELRDEVRRPVTEWEEADKLRRQAHEDAVNDILYLGQFDTTEPAAADIADRLAQAQEVGTRDWEEFAERAAQARADTVDRAELDRLRAEAAERKRLDDERLAAERAAQAERDRAEREAKIAAQAADKARRDAEAKAEADRLAADRRARDAEEALARAERDRIAAAEKAERDKLAAIEAERQRAAAQKAQEEAAERARAEDKRRRGRVHKAEHGRAVIEAIARGQVPAVGIRY